MAHPTLLGYIIAEKLTYWNQMSAVPADLKDYGIIEPGEV
jgi:hypothetical protein